MHRTPSAQKAARQSQRRAERLRPYRTHMKTVIRAVREATEAQRAEEAQRLLSFAMKAIDTAAKKHIIHWRNAARKKSSLSLLCAGVQKEER